MSILKTDIDSLASRLTDSLKSELELAIKEKLMFHADAIVSEVAREMAQNLRSSISTYHDYPNDRLNVTLILDRVQAAVPD